MLRQLTILPFLLTLAAGCNSFDPSLGATPFRCGVDSPRCPDGYTCVTYSPSDEVCESNTQGSDVDAGNITSIDARALDCNDDGVIEPNNSLADPTITTIPQLADTYRLVGLAICPSTDNDYFRFEIDVPGKSVTIDVTYQASRGTLLLDMLDNSGTSVRKGSPTGGDPNVLRAQIPSTPQGVYFAHVRGDGTQNNYSIEISTN